MDKVYKMITTMAGFEVTYHIVTGLDHDEEKSFENELLDIEYASVVFIGVSEGIFITFHYEVDSIDWSLAHHSFLEIEKIIKKYKKSGEIR